MAKLLILLSVLFFSVLTLSGCATTRSMEGKPIMSSAVGKIVNGKTTKPQILRMFGPPEVVQRNPLKPEEVTYKYRFNYRKYVHLGNEILKPSTRKLKERLYIVFKNNVVISHKFSYKGNTSVKKILKQQE